MKASLGALFALEKEIQSSFSLHPVLLHPPLQEECEASHGLKTTRPVDFFFFLDASVHQHSKFEN